MEVSLAQWSVEASLALAEQNGDDVLGRCTQPLHLFIISRDCPKEFHRSY